MTFMILIAWVMVLAPILLVFAIAAKAGDIPAAIGVTTSFIVFAASVAAGLRILI